jgi:hypothetical protein
MINSFGLYCVDRGWIRANSHCHSV